MARAPDAGGRLFHPGPSEVSIPERNQPRVEFVFVIVCNVGGKALGEAEIRARRSGNRRSAERKSPLGGAEIAARRSVVDDDIV
jgi:hypothetical protein